MNAKVVILNAGPDIAGVGIALKQAFDRYAPNWTARAICREPSPFGYQTDILWPQGDPPTRQVYQLIHSADVLHLMDSARVLMPLRYALMRKQRIICQHLGSRFRNLPEQTSEVCQRFNATEVVASFDSVGRLPWLPVTADLEAFAAYRNGHRSQRIRIAHAPTNRAIKSTSVIKTVVERLPVDFDLIEGVSHTECLKRKARADIFVDELTLGYGLNALEAWAMGIPVVSGLADPVHRERAKTLFGHFPWVDANPQTLESVLERLVTDARWRREQGQLGKRHAEQWHAPQNVVRQHIALYENARRWKP